ncbi:MAG TPA: long-chain fatty acid--CoA ligase [Thermoanaerobaculia bacterium]|jgi:fatty-acyl-CoA synthase|nr:long-chain fatty acid--CoA ligase [Thermoanaerobaculia bacterium]
MTFGRVFGDILGERARLTPERTALVYVPTEERFSYAALNERAVRMARVLREVLGLAVDDRFAVLTDNRVEFLDLFFAAPKAGLIIVPLGTRLTPHEIAGILADAAPRALLYGGEHAETVRAVRDLVHIEHWIALDPTDRPDQTDLSDFFQSIPAEDWKPAARGPEDLHCLLYTSGTTGKPKGVMIPHRQVVWNGYNTVIGWQLRDDDVSPIFTPLYHAGGVFAFLVPIFTIGGTIVLHRAFDAVEVWRTIAAERCTVVLGVPTIYKMLLESPEFPRTDLSSVRWLISGGAPLPLYLIEAYQQRGLNFKQGYGLTEVGVNCFAMTVEESVAHAGSIGKPLPYTETRLIDEEDREVPFGEVGELLLRGPHVSRGYWNNPAATAVALDAEGWFHTGDLARRDAAGFHTIAGRKKDMIISGGVNVYPAEIEGELLLHPAVRDAAVVGVPHPTWGEAGVAFVVAQGDPPAAEELTDFLAGRLAKYKIPREIVFVDALPRTAYGKVVKGELRQQYLERLT